MTLIELIQQISNFPMTLRTDKKVGGFLIVTSPRGEVIMLNRRDPIFANPRKIYAEGTLELPGGTIDDVNEDPHTATLREAFEETANTVNPRNIRSAGVFENKKSRVYFFHFAATQEQFEEFLAQTRSKLAEKDEHEHTGVRVLNVWEVYALAREKKHRSPDKDFPEGVTIHRMLALHADVVVYTILKNYGKELMAELKSREREIVAQLKETIDEESRHNVKIDMEGLNRSRHDPERYPGVDGDLRITHVDRKPHFEYRG